jgi:signal transduction histidine kinase
MKPSINTQLQAAVDTLTQRTVELAASNEELRREVEHRRATEQSLRSSEHTSILLLEKSRGMQEELRQLSRRLLASQEEERKNISRELHGVIARTLTDISLQLTALKKQTTASTRDMQRKIAITQRLVAKSVEIVHRFAHELRPAVLDDLGLLPALHTLIQVFKEKTGIRVTLKTLAEAELPVGDVRTVLYRVAQEALGNVARHTQASRVDVLLERQGSSIRMEIRDNGKGFNTNDTKRTARSGRFGLLGMKERVEMVGGTWGIESALGKPTTVRVDIPAEVIELTG